LVLPPVPKTSLQLSYDYKIDQVDIASLLRTLLPMLMPSVDTSTDLYTRATLKIKWQLERDGASFGQVSQSPITKYFVLKHVRNNGMNIQEHHLLDKDS
jgi:hypothetical protein